jgi:protease-4
MCSAAYYIGSATSHIIANKRADAIMDGDGFLLIFCIYENKAATNHRICHNLLRRTKFEELLKGNPELYIKTELDPIA